jgi:hypothetical protein
MNPSFNRQIKESLSKVWEKNKHRQSVERLVLDGVSVTAGVDENLGVAVALLQEHKPYYDALLGQLRSAAPFNTEAEWDAWAMRPDKPKFEGERLFNAYQLIDVISKDMPKIFDMRALPDDVQDLVFSLEHCLVMFLADMKDERSKWDAAKARKQAIEEDLLWDKKARHDVWKTLVHWEAELKAYPFPYTRKDDPDYEPNEAKRLLDYAKFCEDKVMPSAEEMAEFRQCVSVVSDIRNEVIQTEAMQALDGWRRLFADRGVELS